MAYFLQIFCPELDFCGKGLHLVTDATPKTKTGWLSGMEVIMFYPVKVIDDEGKVKKVVNSKELSRRYWEAFYNEMGGENTSKMGKIKHRKKGNKKLDVTNILISSN